MMKKAIIGGFTSIIGTLGVMSVFIVGANNMVGGWRTPPGRFLSTVPEIGMMPLLVCSFIFLIIGLVIMGIEYFKKENR